MSAATNAKRNILNKYTGVSTYINDALYERLFRISEQWSEVGPAVPGPQAAIVTALLNQEGRLLDDGRFEDWLNLFVEECVYWIPSDIIPQDPRREITWELHDRRRLEDRVARIRTGQASSQNPQ